MVMSVEQIEATLLKLPRNERRQFAKWFYKHENEILEPRDDDEISPEMKAEIMRRRREYDEHPEQFVRMDEKSLNRMIRRVRKNVAARLSSAR
jgi:hypothetical protein